MLLVGILGLQLLVALTVTAFHLQCHPLRRSRALEDGTVGITTYAPVPVVVDLNGLFVR